jgi:hypothetical protein
LTTEFERFIGEWIIDDLSSPVAALGGFAKCPYAKKAYLENKVIFVKDYHDLEEAVKSVTSSWDNEKTEVAVIRLDASVDEERITELVDSFNSAYLSEDFIFLDDHVNNVEKMHDVIFNNGRYNVLFLQRRSKLAAATRRLEKTGYYNKWTKEYYDEVVSWRSQGTK